MTHFSRKWLNWLFIIYWRQWEIESKLPKMYNTTQRHACRNVVRNPDISFWRRLRRPNRTIKTNRIEIHTMWSEALEGYLSRLLLRLKCSGEFDWVAVWSPLSESLLTTYLTRHNLLFWWHAWPVRSDLTAPRVVSAWNSTCKTAPCWLMSLRVF